jgi:hypothetical protein
MNPATASAFASWVFRQTNPQRERPETDSAVTRERLRLGTVTHLDIQNFLRHVWSESYFGVHGLTGWTLHYADDTEQPDRTFLASRLTVAGAPLSCRPDVVLTRFGGTQIIMIERKTTFVPEARIPSAGFPNIEAQLWCYSWIDDFVRASKVTLVGQLWTRSHEYGAISLCRNHAAWRRGESAHELRCEAWFRKYGGDVQSA